MRRIAVLSFAAVLAACQPVAPDGAPAAPPADAPAAAPAPSVDFTGDFHLLGTEPFWSVRLKPGEMLLERPDAPALTLARPDPQVEGDTAIWATRELTVRMTATGPCSDGMSDRVYPYTAEITVGGETMKGCGAPADMVFPPA